MPAGRPTEYGKDILEKTKEYLATYEQLGDNIPSVAGLAVYLNIARSTIYDWASQETKKEFSDILDNILSTQERVLLNKGLDNTFNANITKLALGKHGYSDKQELTGKEGKDLFPDEETRLKSKQAISEIINDSNRKNTTE